MENTPHTVQKPNHVMPKQMEHEGIQYPGMMVQKETLEDLKKFQFEKDDILLTTYSRSGTTWTGEQLYLINNEAEEEKAKSATIHERVIYLELKTGPKSGVEIAKEAKGPRLMKTHVLPTFFHDQIKEGKPQVVFVIRNPKDALVSQYHFYEMTNVYGNLKCTFQEFLELFYTKELAMGDWYDHTLSWWALKDLDNVLVMFYEDMKDDPVNSVKKMAKHCGKELSEEQVNKIVMLTSFDKMKVNPKTNYSDLAEKGVFDFKVNSFIRKGEYGGWKKYFTEEDNKRFDALFDEKLKDTGLKLTFE